MKQITLFLLTVIMATGCSSSGKQSSTTEVKNQDVDYTFEVDKKYQAVYRHVLEQARTCTKPQFTAKMVVNGELLEDIKAADISVTLQGLFSNNHYLKIRIDSVSDTRTKIHVINKLPRWNDLARAVKAWVVEGSTKCEESGNTKNSV